MRKGEGIMKKILFLPLMQIRSGHHQVAEALMDTLKKDMDDIVLEKIDILSYSNEPLEKLISSGYLKWIRYAPNTYNLAYKKFFYLPSSKEYTFKWYHHFFLRKMEQLLTEKKPDLIICTHGFPSYILSHLKTMGKCNIPIINAYTDFFMNSFWGREGIDVHFLPSQEAKEELLRKYKVPRQKMIVTGIPVHEEITKKEKLKLQKYKPKILISGGNNGLGSIMNLVEDLKDASQSDFIVLCGKNKKMYQEILSWRLDHIKPLPYISSRIEMNKLYEKADAIITKPGGVTISEVLKKRLPIFIHSVLPGQEKINLKYLKNKGLVFELDKGLPFEKQLLSILKNPKEMQLWRKSIKSYLNEIEIDETKSIAEIINWILEKETQNVSSLLTDSKRRIVLAKA